MADPIGYVDQVTAALGNQITSGYRTQAAQDALVAAGVTKATHSSHTAGTGFDIAPGMTQAQINAKLGAQGLTVTKWLPETGVGPNQGTGAHTHIEVGPMASNAPTPAVPGKNQTAPGDGVVNPDIFLQGLQTLGTEPKSAAVANPDAQENAAITNGATAIPKAEAQVVDKIGGVNQVLDAVTSATGVAHAVQTAQQAVLVRDTSAINDSMSQATRDLQDKVQPVFAARARIADQLDHVTAMNPLLRGIKGIFDLNYDKDYLQNQLGDYDKTLQARAADYDYLNKLHTAAMEEVKTRFNLATAPTDLMVKQLGEDAGIANSGLVNAQQNLAAARDAVTGASQMIQVRQAAEQSVLGKLDRPTIVDLMTQAQKSPTGLVNFNGMSFTPHQLYAEANHRDEQDILVQNYKVAAANGMADLATKNATNIARSLTRDQANQAAANGGVWNGIKLPTDVLATVIQSHSAIANSQANQATSAFDPRTAIDMATTINGQITSAYARQKQIIGPNGNPVASNAINMAADLTRRITAAVQTNAAPEVISALTDQLSKVQSAFMAGAHDGFMKSAGGDPKTAAYMESFAAGAPIDSSTAIAGIAHFASKGSFPEGMFASPEARDILNQAQTIAKNNAIDPRTQKPRTQAQIQEIITQQLPDVAANVIGKARFDRLFTDLPNVAKNIGDPFGGMNPNDWRQVRDRSSAAAASAAATPLNTTPANVMAMMTTHKPLSQSKQDLDLFQKFQATAGLRNTVEQRTMVQEMDDLPSLSPGTRNSTVMENLLHSPKLRQVPGFYNDALASSSMGDYLTHPISIGAVESTVGKFGADFSAQQSLQWNDSRRQARVQAAAYAHDPLVRSQVVMRSIAGVGKDGADALMPTIQGIVQNAPAGTFDGNQSQGNQMTNPATDRPRMQREEQLIVGALANMKFPDPRLEAFRKAAVRGWQSSGTTTHGVISDLLDGLQHPWQAVSGN